MITTYTTEFVEVGQIEKPLGYMYKCDAAEICSFKDVEHTHHAHMTTLIAFNHEEVPSKREVTLEEIKECYDEWSHILFDADRCDFMTKWGVHNSRDWARIFAELIS